ncbi:MAG: PilZ domain-containing protein [Acidobacteriota bacterium]
MDTRKEERLYGIKDVIIRDEGKEFNAILTSISKTGVSVIIDSTFPTYKEIEVRLGIGEDQITLKGSIRWVNDHKGEPGSDLKEIGILFLDPAAEYIEYLDKIKKE